jgi:hypothetical protein
VSRRLSLALWAGALILALGLRLPPLRADLPYLSYVDEGWVLHPVIHLIGARTWDPGFYTYPSLPLYAIAGAAALYSPVYAAVHGRPLAADLAPDPWRHYDLVAPVELIVAGRLLCLAVSLGIVVLTGLLARRLAGEAAGLFAALLAALVPALVIRSAIVTVDPWAAFFTLAAIYYAEGAARSGRPWRDALLSGAMIGCGLTSKYPAVLVALAVVPTLLRVAGGGRRKLQAVALATAAGLLAAAVTMPALVLRGRQVVRQVVDEARVYGAVPIGDYWDQAVRRAEWDLPLEAPELGYALVACAALGGAAAARDRRFSATVFAWALYAAVLAAFFQRYSFRAFRNLLPLVPLACVLAALLWVEVRERLRRPAWADAVAVLGALALLLPAGLAFARDRARQVDARTEAIDWAARNAGPDDVVLVSAELGILESELARLPAEAAELPLRRAQARLRQRGDAALVLTGRFAAQPDLATLLLGGRARVPYERVARFGEATGRGQWGNDRKVVLVFRRAPAAPLATPPAVPWAIH